MVRPGVYYKVYGCSMLPLRKVIEHINDHLSIDVPRHWMMVTFDFYDEYKYDEDGNQIIEEIGLEDRDTHDIVHVMKYPDMGGVDITVRVPEQASDLCLRITEAFIEEIKKQRPEALIKTR